MRQGYDSRSSFPREVRLCWRGVEPPSHSNSTVVNTLFSLSLYGEGDSCFHYEVDLMALTKPLHKVGALFHNSIGGSQHSSEATCNKVEAPSTNRLGCSIHPRGTISPMLKHPRVTSSRTSLSRIPWETQTDAPNAITRTHKV